MYCCSRVCIFIGDLIIHGVNLLTLLEPKHIVMETGDTLYFLLYHRRRLPNTETVGAGCILHVQVSQH